MRHKQRQISLYIADRLEPRCLLSGLLGPVPGAVSSTLTSIDNAMAGISDSVFALPVIGASAKEIDKLRHAFDEFASPLRDALDFIDNLETFVVDAVRKTIGDTLRSIDILGDSDGNHAISNTDVLISYSGLNDFSIGFDLRKQFNIPIPAASLSLGMDSLPIGLRASSGANLSLTFDYDNFRFGRSGGAFFFDTGTSREMKFTLGARLPQTFEVILGVVAGSATNNTVGDNFVGTITADLNGLSVESPRLGGTANFNLGIETDGVGIASQFLPKIKTDLVLSWPFGSPDTGAQEDLGADLLGNYGSFGSPALAFNNLSIGLGPVLTQIIGPVAGSLNDVTRPLQDALDALYTPVPGLSDLSGIVGGPPITLAEIAAFNGALPPGFAPLPESFDNFVHVTTRTRNILSTIQRLASSSAMGNAFINLGSFPVAGPAGGSLLVNTVGQKLGNLLGGALDLDWSQLVALGENLDYQQVVNLAINKAIEVAGSAAGSDVADVLRQLQNSLGLSDPDGVYFDYPVLKDPKGQLVNALLGKDVEFVSMTARWKNQVFGGEVALPPLPVPVQVLRFAANVRPQAEIRVGLDSYGLKQAIASSMTPGGLDPLDSIALYASNSVYVMSDARFNVDASGSGAVGYGVPGFFVGPSISLNGNLLVQLDVSNPGQVRKIRVFDSAGELGSSLFRVSGNIRAAAGLTTVIGIEPLTIDKTWNWTEKTLFSFDTYPNGKIPNPFASPGAPTLAQFESPGILTLNMGDAIRRGRRAIAVNDIHETFTLTQWTDTGNQRVVSVNAYGIDQDFLGVNEIVIRSEDGNDRVTIDSNVSVAVTAFLGSGDDRLIFRGTGTLVALGESGNDKIDAVSRLSNVNVFGGEGDDDLTASWSTGNAVRYVNLNGGAGDDNLTISNNFYSNQHLTLTGESGSDQFNIVAQGRDITLFPAAYSNPAPVNINGGPNVGGDIDAIAFRNQPVFRRIVSTGGWESFDENDTYLITDATIRRQTIGANFDIDYSNIQQISLFMSSGNDSALVTASNRDIVMKFSDGNDRFINAGSNNTYRLFGEDGDDLFNLWGGQAFKPQGNNQFFGGNGIDSIEYDVGSASSSGWTLSPGETTLSVNGGPSASIDTNGWEGVRFTGTNGRDVVNISNGLRSSNVFVNTLAGDDTIISSMVRNPVVPLVFNNINIDAGTGSNTLWVITDPQQKSINIGPDLIEALADSGLGGDPSNSLRISSLKGVTELVVHTGDGDDTLAVDSDPILYPEVSSRRYNLRTFGGFDSITMRNFGALTQTSTIDAGDGYDALFFDDSLITTPRAYTILNGALASQPSQGTLAGNINFTSAEQMVLRTGSANDIVRSQGGATGLTSLSVVTGNGDDRVEGYSSIATDFGSFFTGVSMGAGRDRFTLSNISSSSATPWTFSPTNIVGGNGIIPANIFHYDVEEFEFQGGSGPDVMNVQATLAGQAILLLGGSGNDTYNTFDPATRRTDKVASLITIDDTSGTDTLRADNAGKPDIGQLGDWLHVIEGVLSHTTNDRFFAPGGRVVHHGIDQLYIQTSQANDYVVVAPSASYYVNVYDSNVANSTQDNIDFSIAGVIDPNYVDLLTIWRLQSGNRLNVDVNGFEVPTFGSESPTITQPPVPVFDAPTFYLNLGFDVPMDIFTFSSGEAFIVQNLTTGVTLAAPTMVATDNGVNGFFITFPGHENGLPPDGRYRITLRGDYVRSAHYNPIGADQIFDFNVFRGDVNFDGSVDFTDLLVLAQNYGRNDRSFSTGDFTYDGVVDFNDLLILAQRYGKTLLPNETARRRRTPARPNPVNTI